jgi:hypothetical protein
MRDKKVLTRERNRDAERRVRRDPGDSRAGASGASRRLKMMEIAVENSRLDI